MSDSSPVLPLVSLALLGGALRALVAVVFPGPWDWDAAYYRVVARNMAEGRGAVVDSLYSLSVLPSSTPGPADLHWMPLPSRVLVPGALAWPGAGDIAAVIVLSMALGPLAWWLASSLRLSRASCWTAGLLAVVGGVWMRGLATADVYTLTAVLGGVAFFALSKDKWWVAAGCVALLAITRNDGFVLGFALAIGADRMWKSAVISGAGVVSVAAWTLRNHLVDGVAFWRGRQITSNALHYTEIFDGTLAQASIANRALAAFGAGSGVLTWWLLGTLGLFLPLVLAGAWTLRKHRISQAFVACFVLAPLVVAVLAPVSVHGGTLLRTGAALLVPMVVLLAVGSEGLARWLQARRGYAPAFVLGMVVMCWAAGSTWSLINFSAIQPAAPDCERWGAVPNGQLSWFEDPLLADWHCQRPAVVWTSTLSSEMHRQVTEDYAVCHAVMNTTEDADVDDSTRERLLSGWTQLAPDVWRHPAWNGTDCSLVRGP